jgi:hypothetical protein
MIICKCGSSELECYINKKQRGLWCKKCGKWIKWLNKKERLKYKPIGISNEVAKPTKKYSIPIS